MTSTSKSGMSAKARGDVVLSLEKDGAKFPFTARHNTLSYGAADAVAAAYGGDTSKVPQYIGFVYGENPAPTDIASPSDRDMRWDDLQSEMAAISGNVLVCRFISTPEVSKTEPADSNDVSVYDGNSVTFRACTRSGAAGTYAFDTTAGSGFAGEFGNGMYLYHAVLLGEAKQARCQDRKTYSILGRVSLAKGGTFRQKPEDYELALDWKVTFF